MDGISKALWLASVETDYLVHMLSAGNRISDVLKGACELYGLELHISDDAKEVIELRTSHVGQIALFMAREMNKANLQLDVWLEYNCTFKLPSVGPSMSIATYGLRVKP